MAVAKTKLINLSSSVDNIDNVLLRFIDLRKFHPVLASKIVDTVHGLTSFTTENPTADLITEITEIEEAYGFSIPVHEIRFLKDDIDSIREYVQETYDKIKITTDVVKGAEERIKKFEEAYLQLNYIESLDISLDDLFATQYVSVRFGKIPLDSIQRLKYYQSKPYVFKSFKADEDGYNWCLYITTHEYEREIDNLFSSLFFERIRIPNFVHGTPATAKEDLAAELSLAKSELANVKKQISDLFAEQTERLSIVKSEIYLLNEMYEAKKYVVGMGERFHIAGFMEESDTHLLDEQFKGLADLEITIMPADSDKRIEPPTKLHNRGLFKPFEMFTEMYGLPRYGKLDPTKIIAITYSLLFGIMFGDMGQGFIFMIAGILLYRLKGLRLGGIAISLGLSSMIFGAVYGSLFGYEFHYGFNIMHNTYTMPMLMITVGIGVLLILLSMIVNVIQRFKNKNYPELIFSHNGICGLIFYSFLIVAILPMITEMMMPGLLNLSYDLMKIYFIIPFLIVPLILIFLKEPITRKFFEGHKMFPTGFGGFFVESFFELFEVLLSYITSTISFMRVGGFIISHAGMMLVFTVLKDMVSPNSLNFMGVVIMVIGNIFVMGLEGLVVGIQGLRLEFYEMFSRYYDGGGVAFAASKKEIGGI